MDDKPQAKHRLRSAKTARRCSGARVAGVAVVVAGVFPDAAMAHTITFGGSMEK
jgi:hypothetical protein